MLRRFITVLAMLWACGGANSAQTAAPTQPQEPAKSAPAAKNDYGNGDN